MIDSSFAILDVKEGKAELAKRVVDGEHPTVFILGEISDVWGQDDGESIEFSLDVREVSETGDVAEFLSKVGIDAAVYMCHQTSVDAGWYSDPHTGAPVVRNFGERIALIHSELSEALEAHRKDLMDDKLTHRRGVEVELADAIIRIFDLAGAEGLDLAGALIEKNKFNRNRHDHSPAARRETNGKKY